MTASPVRSLVGTTPELSVGILAADLLRLGEELAVLEEGGVRFVHVDVMDGVFCPQMTAGPLLVAAVPDRFVKDVHLMIEEPLEKVGAYVEAGADVISFHPEATRHPHRVLQALSETGVARGVAVSPGTPLALVEPLLDEIELLLLLAVNPGWPGQTFIPATVARLEQARGMLAGREIALAVDGGITRENLSEIASLDVDLIVSGSAAFGVERPLENIRAMRRTMAGSRPDPGSDGRVQ